MSDITRVTHTVRATTKERMDAIRVAGLVDNWSGTVDTLISAKCEEYESQIPARVADRLRSALVTVADEQERGRRAGDKWARIKARPYQLAVVESVVDPKLRHLHGYADVWPPYGVYCDLNDWAYHKSVITRADAFWAARLADPDSVVSTDFVYGFVAGALSAWLEIKPLFVEATRDIDMNLYGFTIGPAPDFKAEVNRHHSPFDPQRKGARP